MAKLTLTAEVDGADVKRLCQPCPLLEKHLRSVKTILFSLQYPSTVHSRPMKIPPARSENQISNMSLINIPSVEGVNSEPSAGRTLLPEEAEELPVEGRDLLLRLTKYNPEERIRSIFGIQRTAMYKGFDFDKVRRREVRQASDRERATLC